jgi:predicted metal-binding transcription factor (methanogenesis marker protein 9)
MKLLFKIIQHLPETEQIIVKCCRQNAPKPIDDYNAVAIDLMHVDLSSYENFKHSLIMNLVHIIRKQIEDEPILTENEFTEEIDSEDLNDYVNKIIDIDLDEIMDDSYVFKSML